MYVQGVDREESRLGGGGGGSTPTARGIQPKSNIGFIKSFLFESMNEKQSNAFLNLSKSDLFFCSKKCRCRMEERVYVCVVGCMYASCIIVCLFGLYIILSYK